MRSLKSIEDLKHLPSSDPAYPLIEELIQRCCSFDGYDPEDDGWIVLIEEGDIGRPLTDFRDDWTLLDIPWEAVMKIGNFYEGIFLANNQFGVVFVIPDQPWLTEEYRNHLEYHADHGN